MMVYQSFATLDATRGEHRARGWIEPVILNPEDDDGGYSKTEEQAWAACEAALQMMASECLRAAGECRAKAKGVNRVVA